MTAKQLQALLAQAGMSQADLSDELDISARQIGRYYNGHAGIPRVVEIAARSVAERRPATKHLPEHRK